jgi:hypothetical protein
VASEDSRPPKNHPGASASNLDRDAEEAGTSLHAGEAPHGTFRATLGPTSAQPGVQRVESDEGTRGLAALQTAWLEASSPARERFLAWIDETKAALTTLEPKSFETSEDAK